MRSASVEKIPGYSGFVPYKSDLIGLTTGESNRLAQATYQGEKESRLGNNRLGRLGAEIVGGERKAPTRTTTIDSGVLKPQRAMMVSNLSKNSKTWMCGPQHETRTQSIPGYTGFIPGVHSENQFSNSYAKSTAKSFAEKIVKGADLPKQKRFMSMTQKKYNEKNFRRIVEKPDMASMRDYLEYTVTLNQDRRMNKSDFLSSTGNVDKFTKQYEDKSYSTVSPAKHKRDLKGSPMAYYSNEVQVRPKLLEKGLIVNKDFAGLSDNFKKIFAKDQDDQRMKLPIVGYCGHRKGETSENMFAKSYRDTTIQAQRNLRFNQLNLRSNYIK